MRLLAETLDYFSKYSIFELREILKKRVQEHEVLPNILVVDTNELTQDAVILTLFSETIKSFFLEIGKWTVTNPQDMYTKALEVEWYNLLDPNLTFAIRPMVKDPKTMKEIGKNVGQAVVDVMTRETGIRPKVNLSNPDIEIMAWLVENELILALNLCGDELNGDEEILARSLIIASDWDKHSSLGEIFYAGISTSALRYALNDARRERLRYRSFVKLPLIDRQKVLELASKNWKRDIPLEIVCYERLGRLQLVKEEAPEVRKIALRDVNKLSECNESLLISNFIIALEKKSEQIDWVKKLPELLRGNKNWRTLVLLAREDVINEFNLNNKQYEKDIIFKGIRAKMVKYVR